MYNREQIRVFENFLQRIIEKPKAITEQRHIIENGFIWCDDWRIIEILKYFINGRDMYFSDPPPNRLKKNPLWSKSTIAVEADTISVIHKTPEAIVDYLRSEREKPYERSGSL